MKTILPLLFILTTSISCSQVGRQIDEAREAKKKRDSIVKAFKELNDQLQKTHDSLTGMYDSSSQSSSDTSLRR